MQSMLDGYAAQIAALEQGAKAAPQLIPGNAIAPLVKAEWSMDNPFNILLPTLPSGDHAYVGCVATALAQVMYYWKWPARPTCPLPAYTTTTLRFYMPKLPVADFRWDLMKDNYEKTDTVSDEAMAAATLSLYCAQAVKMDFQEDASGTLTQYIPNFAASYFDYDPGAHMENRDSYSTQGWVDLVYGELAAGRPVIYCGSTKSNGHTFICDGFDGNGLFHFNWGWNSRKNGYFVLNVLNPEEQGTRTTYGVYSYVRNQGAQPVWHSTVMPIPVPPLLMHSSSLSQVRSATIPQTQLPCVMVGGSSRMTRWSKSYTLPPLKPLSLVT